MRWRGLAVGVCLFVALWSVEAATQEAGSKEKPNGATQTLNGGVITNPAGLYTQYTYSVPVGDEGLRLGAFSNFQVYSNEFGVQFQYLTDPAFFEVHLDLAFEPGVFRKLPRSRREEPITDENAPERTAGWRAIVRLQSNFNLQLAFFWFYSRTTAQLRYRNFVEQDTFNLVTIEREWSIEQATATFFRLTGTPPALVSPAKPGPSLWTYVEYTVGGIRDVGTRPNRVSAGLLSENWPGEGTVLNLDLYYSFAEPIDGPGAIFVYWIKW